MTQIVAEIGANHQGDERTARHMIRVFTDYCTTTFHPGDVTPKPVLKFQKRTPGAMSVSERIRPYTSPNSFGPTYGEHRDALEFDIDTHRKFKQCCEAHGAAYACSVWDVDAATEVMGLYPEWIKIPSACNLDFQLLGRVCSGWEGPIHISLGMTTAQQVEQIVSYVERMGVSKRTWLYGCTSAYPCPMDAVHLLDIQRLNEVYGHRVAGIGFSGHHNGVAVDMVAVAMRVDYLERHVTLDRTWKGSDHAASLEPDGFRKVLRDAQAVQAASTERPAGILDVEVPAMEKLKRKATDRVIPQRVKDAEASEDWETKFPLAAKTLEEMHGPGWHDINSVGQVRDL